MRASRYCRVARPLATILAAFCAATAPLVPATAADAQVPAPPGTATAKTAPASLGEPASATAPSAAPLALPPTDAPPGDWLARVETLLAPPAKAQEAVAFLEHLPLSIRETSDYHWAAAHAYLAAGRRKHAASAMATYALLPTDHPRDLGPIKEQLARYANEYLQKALACLQRKDEAQAAENYSNAVFCDQAVLGREDEGLGERTMLALDQKVQQGPVRPERWFVVGFYNFHFSHLEAARKAFQEYLARVTDPYQQWHARLWLAATDAQASVERQQRQQEQCDAQARRNAQDAADEAEQKAAAEQAEAAKPTRAEIEMQRLQEQVRRQGLHAEMREVDRELKAAQHKRAGRIVILPNGSIGVWAYNQREVKREIQDLESRKQQLQSELDGE